MAQRRIIDDKLYVHFITFSVHARRRLLDHERPKRILLGVLNEQIISFQAKCAGFVIMPDHVHAAIWLPKTGQLSRFVHSWKRISSFHIRKWHQLNAPSYFKDFEDSDKFWNPKYYAFEIFETDKLEEKLRYMHENPVRLGLVNLAADWKWSSAGWYETRCDVGVPIQSVS
jgi:putative transposase